MVEWAAWIASSRNSPSFEYEFLRKWTWNDVHVYSANSSRNKLHRKRTRMQSQNHANRQSAKRLSFHPPVWGWLLKVLAVIANKNLTIDVSLESCGFVWSHLTSRVDNKIGTLATPPKHSSLSALFFSKQSAKLIFLAKQNSQHIHTALHRISITGPVSSFSFFFCRWSCCCIFNFEEKKKLRRLLTFLSLSESRKSWRRRWKQRWLVRQLWGNCRCFISPSRSLPSRKASIAN